MSEDTENRAADNTAGEQLDSHGPGKTTNENSEDQLLEKGILEFNSGEFFECHETLETLWNKLDGDFKQVVQGIIQVAVAFYHLNRSNHRGATTLLGKGTGRLDRFGISFQAPTGHKIDYRQLREHIVACLALCQKLAANPDSLELDPERKSLLATIPNIELTKN